MFHYQEEEDVKKALNKLVVRRKSLVDAYQSNSEGEVKEKEPKKKSKPPCCSWLVFIFAKKMEII